MRPGDKQGYGNEVPGRFLVLCGPRVLDLTTSLSSSREVSTTTCLTAQATLSLSLSALEKCLA